MNLARFIRLGSVVTFETSIRLHVSHVKARMINQVDPYSYGTHLTKPRVMSLFLGYKCIWVYKAPTIIHVFM